MNINRIYKEIKNITVKDVYGKDIDEKEIPGYEVIDFRPPAIHKEEIVLSELSYKPFEVTYQYFSARPLLILKKNLRKRYIFEESKEGVYGLTDFRPAGLHFNSYYGDEKKRFILKEEEF